MSYPQEDLRTHEAYLAAHEADSARDRMLEAEHAFEIAQREFNTASGIAAIVLGPSEAEKAAKGEFVTSPLGEFVTQETARLKRVNDIQEIGSVKLETWSRAFNARAKIVELFPQVAAADMHVVLAPKKRGDKVGTTMTYCGNRGIDIAHKRWNDIMSRKNKDSFLITLDSGESLDCRKGMTFENYLAMIKQVHTIDGSLDIDKYLPPTMKAGFSNLTKLSWLTGEKLDTNIESSWSQRAVAGFVNYQGEVIRAQPYVGMPLCFRPSVKL